MSVFHRRYVAIVAFSTTVDAGSIKEKLDELLEFITTSGGKQERVEKLGVKKLSYPVKKQTNGSYHEVVFILQDNKELGQNLFKINKMLNHVFEISILRSMVLRIEEKGLKNDALKNFSAFDNNSVSYHQFNKKETRS